MGIAGGANAWWQDVLENGRTSAYAEFFDIDWRPLKEELRGKILLPVLGDHYGVVLERGELRLEYADGAFTVHYYETRLPIAPPTYPLILSIPLPELEQTLPEDDLALLEYQSIITAFERLPPQDERDPDLDRRAAARADRRQTSPGRPRRGLPGGGPRHRGDGARPQRRSRRSQAQAHGFDALDRLLDAQSYRLSSFRTAGEEINYRRFFAINELAAVRQEVPEVFAAAHALLLRLIASGAVTGLRIDHPDGLWDPAGYFRDLQRAAWMETAARRQDGKTASRRDGEAEIDAGAYRLGRHRSGAGGRLAGPGG